MSDRGRGRQFPLSEVRDSAVELRRWHFELLGRQAAASSGMAYPYAVRARSENVRDKAKDHVAVGPADGGPGPPEAAGALPASLLPLRRRHVAEHTQKTAAYVHAVGETYASGSAAFAQAAQAKSSMRSRAPAAASAGSVKKINCLNVHVIGHLGACHAPRLCQVPA